MTLPPIADKIETALNPEWGTVKAKLEKTGKGFKTAGLASTVSAVALFILGIILCATANPAGVAPILISLPLFYTGCNSLVFGKNLKSLADNPKKCCDWEGFGEPNPEKIKKHLLKGTFGLSPLYDFGAKKLGIPTKSAGDGVA
jgi:hypothetical protein